MSAAARLAPPAVALSLALALTGCGASDDADATGATGGTGGTPSESAASSASSSPVDRATQTTAALAVTVEGDTVSPKNQRLRVELGTSLAVVVTSDRAGELHVHSSPEQTYDFGAGTSRTTFTFTTPGVVELEEHGSDTLVAQLEVR